MEMVESASLARDRAEIIRQALILRGIAPGTISIVPATAKPFVPEAFDGLDAPAPRRVDVRIVPVAAP